MTLTIYPKGKQEISAGVEDRTELDSITAPIFRYVEGKHSVSLLDVYGGDYEIPIAHFVYLEEILEHLRLESYKQKNFIENGNKMAEQIDKFVRSTEHIVTHCKQANIPIMHFAD